MNSSGLSRRQAGAAALTAAGLPVFRSCCGVSWPWVLLGASAAALTLDVLSIWTARSERGSLRVPPMLPLLGALWAARESNYAFPETAGSALAAVLVLLLGLAAAWRGAEALGRCAGILLWVTGALYGSVLLFSLPQLRPERLTPAGSPVQALRVWLSLLPPGAALCLPAEGERSKALRWPWWAAAGAALAASLVTNGLLSPPIAAEPEPFRTLARGVSVLGVIRRFEALGNGAMLMSGFSLCALLLTAALSCMDRNPKQNRTKHRAQKSFGKMKKSVDKWGTWC